jgi:hypothetical protein
MYHINRETFHICMDYGFNRQLESLPKNLTSFQFSYQFNQLINANILPDGLKNLHFGAKFNQPLDYLPSQLQVLEIGYDYHQSLQYIIPDSLTIFIDKSRYFMLEADTLPSSLSEYFLGSDSKKINSGVIPKKCQLYLPVTYYEILPVGLDKIIFYGSISSTVNSISKIPMKNYINYFIEEINVKTISSIFNRNFRYFKILFN